MDNFDIASLFPTPLLKVEIPPELSTACNLFDNTEMLHKKPSQMTNAVYSKLFHACHLGSIISIKNV